VFASLGDLTLAGGHVAQQAKVIAAHEQAAEPVHGSLAHPDAALANNMPKAYMKKARLANHAPALANHAPALAYNMPKAYMKKASLSPDAMPKPEMKKA